MKPLTAHKLFSWSNKAEIVIVENDCGSAIVQSVNMVGSKN